MEPLPKGANFRRAKILWELGLHIAGNPETPYGGNRDMCIVVGSGSGESFKPWLRLATGSAVMAHAVAKGEVEAAFVNPSAMLTQAYRGVGLFDRPLDLRILGNYPSMDRFVIAMKQGLGFTSLADVKKARYPLRISLREDPTHSTLVLIEQILSFHGMSLEEIKSWGGSLHSIGGPGDQRRLAGIRDGSLDAIFDEGISAWIDDALQHGFVPIDLDAAAFTHLESLGWRRMPLKCDRFPKLPDGHQCIDFSGWPLYASASLPDEAAYEIADAFGARHDEMPWEEITHQGIAQVGTETEATPMDVPLHPGAERWYRERGYLK
ncbi:MAG: TAXI family TRAP transporter solute-binding subunit [Hyphomicrobiaceae bacterium]